MDSPFHDTSMLLSAWRDPNVVRGEEVLVAEMDGRIVGCVTVEDRGRELELVNIDVPRELQGRGIGTMLVRSVEERAGAAGKQAVTVGTSRNAEGVAWKSLPWWQHLGYRVTHEEEHTPSGEVATAAYYGDDYTQMAPVYQALEQWCASNGRPPAGMNWEVYGDPAEDPAQTRTDIYFLLRPAAG